MDALADTLLDLLAAFGLGVLLVLGVGFYLFYQLKRDADRRDPPRNDNRPGTDSGT